jgi:hypothetical protein
MHEDTLSLWLKITGLRATSTRSVAPADVPGLSDTDSTEQPQPAIVADLDLADDHDDSVDDGSSGTERHRRPGDPLENTELVSAVFRAAGNPTYQDVRLKSAKTDHCSGPTHREIAVQRGKRLGGSTTW